MYLYNAITHSVTLVKRFGEASGTLKSFLSRPVTAKEPRRSGIMARLHGSGICRGYGL